MFLLDASVWVAAGIPAHPSYEEAGAVAHGNLPVTALDLTLYEVTNAVGGRYGQPEQARRIVEAIVRTCGNELHRVSDTLVDAITEDVVAHGLTAYDAAYVSAARQNGWQLVSLDIRDLVSKGLAVTPDAAVYP